MTSKHLRGGVSALSLLAALTLASAAQATEGYFQTGYGTNQKALSGAGVANPEDAMTLSVNPAGLVSVGRQFQASFTLFSPHRSYEAGPTAMMPPTGFGLIPGKRDSNSTLFLMPNMAYSAPIDAQSAWGVALFGNGGMSTNYHSNVFYGGNAGVNLEQMFLSVGYARKMGDLSIGVAPVVAMQKFRAMGIGPMSQMSLRRDKFSDNGDDYSYGAGFRAGIQWDLTKSLRFGLSGQTPIWSTEFDKYSGLFAEGGSFDVPASITAGLAWDVTPAVTLMADYRHIFYGSVKAISNPSTNFGNCQNDPSYCFGGSNGSGFGWHDVDVFSVGAAWKINPDLTLRVGYSHNTNPIKSADVMLNILAPGVVTDHFSGGLSYNWSKNLTIDLAGAYVPSSSVSGMNPMAPDQTLRIKMHQYEASLGVRYRY